ncbi:prepilin-type N-terminal cleavage/methylation domain-containing protein [bacterium]|nr:prepilin-type N-terminal cleavage/methylation domain-containing protein [bacterium]
MKPRHGFSLVEVMVVLLLVSLMFGTMVVTFRTPYQRAQQSQAIARVTQMDRLARILARRNGGVLLVVDTNKGEGRILDLKGDKNKQPLHVCSFGEEAKLTIYLSSASLIHRPKPEERIPYDANGYCSGFAASIESAHSGLIWIYFAGGSSDPVVTKEKREIDALLSL